MLRWRLRCAKLENREATLSDKRSIAVVTLSANSTARPSRVRTPESSAMRLDDWM
jgi:hypothetical protein